MSQASGGGACVWWAARPRPLDCLHASVCPGTLCPSRQPHNILARACDPAPVRHQGTAIAHMQPSHSHAPTLKKTHTRAHAHMHTHTHTHVAHTRMAHTRIWHTRMRTHTRAHTSRQVALGYSCWSSAHRQGTAIPHKQTPYPHLPPFHFLMFEHGIEDAGPHITDGLPINHARAGGTGLRQAANG